MASHSEANLARLQAGARRLGLELTPGQLSAFQQYRRELLEWNNRFNLTAITDPAAIEERHFLDSLTVLQAMPVDLHESGACSLPPGLRLVDVGSGAGFPGVPLKIVCPDLQVTLVEATGKKAAFLDHLVQALGLQGVEVVNRRAEEAGQDPRFRQRFDWAVARAVANMAELAEYLLPLVRVGGRCLAMKGANVAAEVAEAEYAIRELGGRLARQIPVMGGDGERTGTLVVLDKIRSTPGEYPRRPGMPHKSPLRKD